MFSLEVGGSVYFICFVGVSYMVGGDFRFLHLGVFSLKVDGVMGLVCLSGLLSLLGGDVIGLCIFSADDSDCESDR